MTLDPRPTDSLDCAEAWPFEDDAAEVTIRVSAIDPATGAPAEYQALVKHRDATVLWGVGIKSNPVEAISEAISSFYERNACTWSPADRAGAANSRYLAFGGYVGYEMAAVEGLTSQDAADDFLGL